MELSLLFGIAGFAFITSVTPGPNNMMLLASGAQFGFVRTLPHIVGIVLGVAALLLSVLLGLGVLFTLYPQLFVVLNVAGSLYLLWLAWKIASGPVTAINAEEDIEKQPLTWWQAALFQLSCQIGNHFIGVHICTGTGSGLEYIHRKMLHQVTFFQQLIAGGLNTFTLDL